MCILLYIICISRSLRGKLSRKNSDSEGYVKSPDGDLRARDEPIFNRMLFA